MAIDLDRWPINHGSTGQALQQAIWLGNYPVALINASAASAPEVAYIQPDHLGTPRVVIDWVRNLSIWQWSSKSRRLVTKLRTAIWMAIISPRTLRRVPRMVFHWAHHLEFIWKRGGAKGSWFRIDGR
ncbi:hypothetical protein [Stenotrophomonas sp. 278]|uniref:hypothetical protein n=1 Tax=Stenotrophomonas sp. 278 TaxID=2479851 RepID=UPI000F66D025|nr:hypothetical protein [Stenotrophomonas sp. 278]RRU06387.1 hypothetical protein EGJ34_17265 [Stenotrophomonas sp. 278]